MLLSGKRIEELEIVYPFTTKTVVNGMSFGVGPCGYDMRIEFDIDGEIEQCVLNPGDFILASTMEHFKMPYFLAGIVHDKSSWARLGVAVQNTVIEPGWEGYLTLELTNHGKNAVTLNRGDPICQVLFHLVDGAEESAAYNGKYQHQRRGPVEAILES